MFATAPRMRQYRSQQEEQRPTGEMGDSNYGVRSIGSEADWGGSSILDNDTAPARNEEEDHHDDVEVETNLRPAEPAETKTDIEVAGVESGSGSRTKEWTPTTDQTSLPLSLPPPISYSSSSSSPVLPSPQMARDNDQEPNTERLPHAYQFENDDLSEPSSPASFASMPSYMSSLSRTSSLAGEGEGEGVERSNAVGSGLGMGIGMGGSEELVMPLLNVSHAGPARGRGIKVVILGNPSVTDQFMNGLKEVKEVVELRKGEYGVVDTDRDRDRVVATLSTGLSSDEVESRIERAYTALDGVLHPNPPLEARDQITQLIIDYASKSDWIHLLYILDAESSIVDALAQLVPTLSNSSETISPLLDLPIQSTSPAHSHPLGPEPTPRPNDEPEASSYFGSSQPNDVHRFIHALTQIQEIQQASVTKFLGWRPAPARPADMASSHTSHSSEIEAAAMPTVARAQGGGEWEANLSRRLAKRRQSVKPDQTLDRHTTGPSGGGSGSGSVVSKRKSSTSTTKHTGETRRKTDSHPPITQRPTCGPLFPPIPSSSDPYGSGKRPGAGLYQIFDKTFGSLRKRWKWGVVAATALALAVGWNWVKGV